MDGINFFKLLGELIRVIGLGCGLGSGLSHCDSGWPAGVRSWDSSNLACVAHWGAVNMATGALYGACSPPCVPDCLANQLDVVRSRPLQDVQQDLI